MTKRMLALDPATGSTQFVDYDENTDTFRVVSEIEASPLLDLNQKFYNETPEPWRDGAVVARMQMEQLFNLQAEGILGDPKRLSRWLNDPDYRKFRVRPGWIDLK